MFYIWEKRREKERKRENKKEIERTKKRDIRLGINEARIRGEYACKENEVRNNHWLFKRTTMLKVYLGTTLLYGRYCFASPSMRLINLINLIYFRSHSVTKIIVNKKNQLFKNIT